MRKTSLVGSSWKDWSFDQYLMAFLSRRAAQSRLHGQRSVIAHLTESELIEFCRPIRDRLTRLYSSASPTVSLVLPAYNEEVELLPTLLGLCLVDLEPGQAELIVVDNASTDATAAIIQACGARYVSCLDKGVGYCRRAGLKAVSPSTEFVWLSDSDTRLLPPFRTAADAQRRATLFRTALRFLAQNPKTVGVSTGGVIETAHWSYYALHWAARLTGRAKRLSCWSGCNQFFRRGPLDEIGIDVDVEFGDDHHRHYELARYAKRRGLHLASGNSHPSLVDPVYTSGRRYATLGLALRHYQEARSRSVLPKDEFGYPIHPRNLSWRQVRPASD